METKNRIRELRKSMNLSQEALAAILCTSQQAVSRRTAHTTYPQTCW